MPNRSSTPARGVPVKTIHLVLFDDDVLNIYHSNNPDPEIPDVILVPLPNSSFGIVHHKTEVWRVETSPDTLNLFGRLRRAWSILTWKSK